MERIEYRGIVDKADWPRGEWHDEPDKIQWQDDATGLPCLIVRGPVGALCGYVGIPAGHPMHGKDYNDFGGDVHGGLNFAHGCAEITPEKWEAWRSRKPSLLVEAAKYPHGDAANSLKEWSACWDDYEAWAKRAHARSICHLPAPGEPDNVWWLGFDCAHLGDLCPGMRQRSYGADDYYKNIAYVENECCQLAKQLSEHDALAT